MKATDIEAVVLIEGESFSEPWSQAAFVQEMVNDRAHYLVIEEDDKIIGYGGFWQILDEGHFTNLAIVPEYRNRGFGSKIITAMLNYARTIEITSVTLEVREHNENALRAYKALGFHIEAKRSHYYTKPVEDALIMWLSL